MISVADQLPFVSVASVPVADNRNYKYPPFADQRIGAVVGGAVALDGNFRSREGSISIGTCAIVLSHDGSKTSF
jgi:hypothetical protein